MSVRLSPQMVAKLVCHDEQLEIWADDMIDAVSDWLEIETYDEKLALDRAVKREISQIVEAAFELAKNK